MLFRRREPEDFRSRMRTLLWPRRSFGRSFLYLKKRVLRLNATPHEIAAGFAVGIFASFTPFLGFHFMMAFALAFLCAGNMAAAALGTVAANPLTFPFIWGITYEVGQFILHSEPPEGHPPVGLATALTHMNFRAIWTPILEPMTVGSIVVGGVAAMIAYGLVYWGATGFQRRRTRRIIEGRASRRAAVPRRLPGNAGRLP